MDLAEVQGVAGGFANGEELTVERAADTPQAGSEFVVLANRLPVRRVRTETATVWQTSPGGLVAALGPILERRNSTTWVGWPGTTGGSDTPSIVDNINLEPVPLSRGEVQLFYEGFSNATLWPLYHDSIIRSEYHRTWWDSYLAVNRRFAKRAAARSLPGATVWVHDYHLQLVPWLLRSLRPDLRIGFFLHIPFPPVELFVQLPWRRQLLLGLLGADVVGFQTPDGAANLRALVERLGIGRVEGDDVVVSERRVTVRAFPISVDATRLRQLAGTPAMKARAAETRASLGHPECILLGVDRLDYTKGIARRIEAFGELLAEERLEVPRHVMIQVAEPTRENVGGYPEFRDRIDALVGDINGTHGLVGQPAVNYIHRSLNHEEILALYLAADVMLVTPVRDGMNLVAKEYVAARQDDTGVLVLSEFTGAAQELTSALLVNPYDTDGLKNIIERAVHLPADEARARMHQMSRHVLTHDVHAWARDWMDALGVPFDDSDDAPSPPPSDQRDEPVPT